MNKEKLTNRPIKLAYLDEGSGTPVVLLHGFCGSSRYWEQVIPLLAPHCRLIVPDLPGHGQSSVPDSSYTIESYADDIAQLLLQLGIPKAIWLGHSLGGYITLAAVERHPKQMSAFGLIHSTAYPDDDQGKANRKRSIETVLQSGIAAFVDGLIPKLFASDHVESMPRQVEQAKAIGYGTSPEGAIAALKAMAARPDRNSALSDAACPVLLVAGEHDRIINPDKISSAQNERLQRTMLPDVGHMSMMEAPERLAQTLLSFLPK